MEKVVPSLTEALDVIEVLPKNATGQKITSYVSFIKGPTGDDVRELHIVLLDNGRLNLAADPDYVTVEARRRNRERLTEVLDAVYSTDTTAAWLAKLQGLIPASPVYDLPQALDNPFVREIRMLRDLPHPQKADYRVLANPIKLAGERLPSRLAPPLGAQTDEVLRAVGYDDAQIAELRTRGVA